MNDFPFDPAIPLTTFNWGNWQHEFDPEKPFTSNPSLYCYSDMSALNSRNPASMGYAAYLDSAIGMSESPATTEAGSSTTHSFFEKHQQHPTPATIPSSSPNTRKRAAAFDESNVFLNAFSALNEATTATDDYSTHLAKRQKTLSYEEKTTTGFTPSPTFSDSGYASQQSSPTFSSACPTNTTTPALTTTTTQHDDSTEAAIRAYRASVHSSMQNTFYKKFLRPTFRYPAQARDQLEPIMKGVALNRPEDRPMETKIFLRLNFQNNTIRGERRLQRRNIPREIDMKMREAEGKDYLNPRGYGKPRFCIETGRFVPRGRDGRRR